MKHAHLIIVAILLLVCNTIYAKPMVTDTPYFYYKTPDIFFTGKPITPLTPTATGIATPPYSAPVTIPLSGITAPKATGADQSGNLYVLDTIKEKVYKLAAGTTTPVAWSAGFAKGTAIATDYQGNSFIADASDNKIIMKPYSGGTPAAIYTDSSPIRGLAASVLEIEGALYIYIIDGSSTIKAFNWPAMAEGNDISAGLISPTSIAIDNYNYLYVTDPGSNGVYKISVASPYTKTLLYTDTNYPNSIAVDYEGNVFVTDKNTNNVVMIPVAGTPFVVASGLNKPVGLSISVFSTSPIYLCDSGNGAVKQVNRVGGYYTPQLPAGITMNIATGVISGTPITASPPTDYYITAYNGSSSSTSRVNLRVGTVPLPVISYTAPPSYTAGVAITPLVPSSSGVAAFGYSSPATGTMSAQYTTDIYDASGNQYIKDDDGILEYPVNGTAAKYILKSLVNSGSTLAIDSAHNFYSGGLSTTTPGQGVVVKYPAGGGTPVILSSAFPDPLYVNANAGGDVYVLNGSVQKIPAGTTTPLLISSNFINPDGMVIDPTGNLFVSDPGTHSSKFGSGSEPGKGIVKLSTTPPYTQTMLYTRPNNTPYSLTVDAGGNVYFTNDIPVEGSVIQMVPAGGGPVITLATKNMYYANYVNSDPKGNLDIYNQGGLQSKMYRTGGYYLGSGTPLVPGLKFDVNTGIISGTPTVNAQARKYTVIAYNGSGGTSTTFNIVVKPANPANDTLAMLSVSSGTLTPAFAPATFNYRDTVSVDTINLTPLASNPGATIRVNGTVLPRGSAAKAGLAVGNNTVTVSVTSPDSSAVANYTLVINRFIASTNDNLSALAVNKGTLSPAFNTGVTAYTDTVLAATANLVVTSVASDATAVIKVNGVMVASGSPSANLPLVTDSINTVTVLVTAQSGAHKSYVITVNRPLSSNDSLSNIVLNDNAILSPAFNADSLTYNTAVTYSYTSITVKPIAAYAGASITVNGVAVHSGAASAPVALPVGTTGIRIVVKAPDGSVRTYIVRVKRNLSTNNLLANLTLNGGAALSPAFIDTVYTYNSSVANSVSSIMFKPLAADTTEAILVNGVAVASGTFSQAISLPVGSKTIKVLIHAQSGAANAYNVTITRAAAALALAQIIPYPDPVIQMVNFNVGNTVNKNVNITMYSVLNGSLVYTKQLNNISGIMQLDISALKSGIYVVHLSLDGIDKSFKIVKQ